MDAYFLTILFEQWLVRGRGIPVTEGMVRRETQASNENEEEGKERKQRRVCAAKSTREGIRLWWWMAGGNGADARGPRSVRTGGTRAQTHTGRGPDAETVTRDGREADEHEDREAVADGDDCRRPRNLNPDSHPGRATEMIPVRVDVDNTYCRRRQLSFLSMLTHSDQ